MIANHLLHIWHLIEHSFFYIFEHGTQEEWTQAEILMAIGLGLIFVADLLLGFALNRWLKPLGQDVVDKVIPQARGPVGLFIFGYFFLLAFDSFNTMPHLLWQKVHADIYPVVTSIILLVLAYRMVDIVGKVLKARWSKDSTELDLRWADLIGNVGKGIVLAAGVLVLLNTLGVNILPLLTGAGFLGAAIALASQNTIANAIGSMEIMMGRLFKEGDRVSFGEYDGFVTGMGLRSIQLAALTGEKITLPNKDLVDKQIRNYSKNKLVRTTITVGVTYDNDRASIERIIKLMEKAVSQNKRVNSAKATFVKFGESALNLQVSFWADYKDYEEYNELINDLNLHTREEFDTAGIEFAFPTSTVVLKSASAGEDGKKPAKAIT
jgi:MscS family membrane protein